MRRNRRRVVVGLVVLAVGGGFAIFELTSGDAPPPPTLSADDRGFAGIAAGERRPGRSRDIASTRSTSALACARRWAARRR
jgi:hypothetical protein